MSDTTTLEKTPVTTKYQLTVQGFTVARLSYDIAAFQHQTIWHILLEQQRFGDGVYFDYYSFSKFNPGTSITPCDTKTLVRLTDIAQQIADYSLHEPKWARLLYVPVTRVGMVTDLFGKAFDMQIDVRTPIRDAVLPQFPRTL